MFSMNLRKNRKDWKDLAIKIARIASTQRVKEMQKGWWERFGSGILLGQWLNFKLFGITYLVGKIKFKLFFGGSIG